MTTVRGLPRNGTYSNPRGFAAVGRVKLNDGLANR